MPSRLSSLLVRDGLVGVKRMEKAFQRQVIYGGSLDTILLEMGLVPDERLTQYLSLASGLPPASRAETNVFDAEAVRRCPEDVAHRHRVVPLCLEGDALRVLVCEPVDMQLLEDLADTIDLPVQPLIVPEYRWHVVFARAYGAQAPARFTTLAKQIDAAPPTAPVGKPRTVIVEELAGDPGDGDPGADHVVVDVKEPATGPTGPARVSPADLIATAADGVPLRPVGPEAATMRMDAVAATPEARLDAAVTAAVPVAAAVAVAPVAAVVAAAPVAPAQPPRTRTVELSADAYQAALRQAEAARIEAEERRRAPTGDGVPQPVPPQHSPGDAVIRAPLAVGDTPDVEPQSPMSAIVAREALQVADDRDRVFLVLLRALRSRARWAGLLTVQGGAAIGRTAIGEPGTDLASIASVLIPLDTPSAFREAITSQRPHVGPVTTGDADVDQMIARLGGTMPPAALLLPVVLRERVVALAVAHRMDDPIGLADVAELLPLAGVAADAIGRLIVRHKSAGYRAPEPGAVVQVSVEDVDTKRLDRPPASAWRIPTAQPAVEVGTEVSVTAEPARPIADVLDELERAGEGAAEALFTEAVERAAEVVPAIAARFPGVLRVDRFQVSGRALRAAQYGALLELVVRIGPPVTDVLIEKMSDPNRDVRFYATVCAGELRPRSAVYALVERLFDGDYGVRACAMEALVGYPLRDLDSALARARHALHSDDPERVAAAASAVAELGDVHAIPDLLDTVGRDARRGEHARRALVALTKADFGTSERKWRKWWEEHKARHRIEWLIEALTHKELALRQAAADDLRKLTGEHFGYHHDLPRRDREQSQQRWRQWWQETGRRRFSRDDDERQRPTAMLPQLRRD